MGSALESGGTPVEQAKRSAEQPRVQLHRAASTFRDTQSGACLFEQTPERARARRESNVAGKVDDLLQNVKCSDATHK